LAIFGLEFKKLRSYGETDITLVFGTKVGGSNPPGSTMHKAKKLSIVVSCIDYRFWPQALPLLRKKYGEFDLIQLAGASKNLASPLVKENKTTLLENIKISIQLHSSERIILVNHIDCGAYGGSKNFTSEKAEIGFHKKEMEKAKKIILMKFPRISINTELLILDADRKIKLL
jgi:carbonic anhydrase